MVTEYQIKFRKGEDGKTRAIVRGGRPSRIIQSKKCYNRKEAKEVKYED